MRTGIQHSINTVAVKMLQQIGVREGINFTKSLGITTLVENGEPNDIGLSFALGVNQRSLPIRVNCSLWMFCQWRHLRKTLRYS